MYVQIRTATSAIGVTLSLPERQLLAAYLLSESPWLNLCAAGDERLFVAAAQHRFRRRAPEAAYLHSFYQDVCLAARTLMGFLQRWAQHLARAPPLPDLPVYGLPIPEGQYIFRGYRMDPVLPPTPPSVLLPLASFTTSPEVAMQFACQAVQSMHFREFLDPRTQQIFGGGTSGLRVFLVARVCPGCSLVPLGPAAVKVAEHEVLSASVRFMETYRRSVHNPAILPLLDGCISPVPDVTQATRDSATGFLRSRRDILFAPHEILFISGELRPLAPPA